MSLSGLIRSGWPLPLGWCRNRRSMVYVGNLCSLISNILKHEPGPNAVYLVSDGGSISVAEIIRAMGRAMGKTPLLFPVPHWLLHLGANIIGKREEMMRLTQSLEVDIQATCDGLGWQPPYLIDEALKATLRDE